MKIRPFRGYRYNAAVVGDVGRCISPPYDVIDADQQVKLHERSKYNIARVIKGESQSGDDDTENVYSRAGATLRGFTEQGALKQDASEQIYVYAQDFTMGAEQYRRSGFVALGQLEAYGGAVKPHEQTLVGPKADRLNLMRATRSQIGQIFVLYDEADKTIDAILQEACAGEELLCHADDDGVTHRLFAVTDEKQIATITAVMAERNVFIADGHHRYETALNYYQETQNPAAAYRMMTFVNMHNEGLLVLPTHRLIKQLADFSPALIVGRMQEHFDVARLEFGDIAAKAERRRTMLDGLKLEGQTGEHALGMYLGDGAFYLATLRDVAVMDTAAPGKSEAYRQLDVAILHRLVLGGMLGIDEAALAAETNVEYIKDFGQATARAIDRVDSGECQGLFFMNATRAEEVEAVSLTGEKMPQKSTFFWPKMFSGLVLKL